MAEAGVRTNRELKKRLSRVGYRVSEAKLCRLRKTDLKSIDLDLLAALCAVLATSPNELLAPAGGWPRSAQALPTNAKQPDRNAGRGIADPSQQNDPPDAPTQSESSTMLGPCIRAVISKERTLK